MADTGEGKKEEADYKRLHSFPLIRHSDMPEEMRVEAMELCVTACEKYATNNEDHSCFCERLLVNVEVLKYFCAFLEQKQHLAFSAKAFAILDECAAKMIKETMDKKFGSSWHVVIGEGFGFEITHEVKNLLYMFFGGSLAVCVWKCS